jgi:hypothetical protein
MIPFLSKDGLKTIGIKHVINHKGYTAKKHCSFKESDNCSIPFFKVVL